MSTHLDEQRQPEQPGQSGPQIPEEMTVEHLQKIFFHSYHFSQGKLSIQADLLRYTKAQHPTWHISFATKQKMKAVMGPAIVSFLNVKERGLHGSNAGTNSTGTLNSVGGELQLMQGIFEDLVQPDREQLLASLLEGIANKDMHYLELENGRPRKPHQSGIRTPLQDPWLSHLCHYSLQERSTGVPEFDQMFLEIRQFVQKLREVPPETKFTCSHTGVVMAGELLEKITEIIRIHNEKHPDDVIDMKTI